MREPFALKEAKRTVERPGGGSFLLREKERGAV